MMEEQKQKDREENVGFKGHLLSNQMEVKIKGKMGLEGGMMEERKG